MNDTTLFLGDAKEVLPQLSDQSIQAVITDAPYFLDGMGTNWDTMREPSKRVGNLPKGMKFDPQQGVDLEEFAFVTGKELFRVLVPGGYYATTMSPRLTHRYATGIERAGFEIRDLLIWKHQGGQAKAASQVSRLTPEDAHLKEALRHWKTPQLRPLFETIILGQKPKVGTYINNWKKYGVGLINMSTPVPSTIFDFKKERGEHLTTKPVALFAQLIHLLTQPGQTILDPFMGSGTTGVAARGLHRKFIGIEILSTHFDLATQRLAKHPPIVIE